MLGSASAIRGDGCGSNWPTCHGEVIPQAPSTATLVEFTHRLTSGLCGRFRLRAPRLVVDALRSRPPVTRLVALTLLFIVFEGAIGAGLVLGELVADDASVARAVVIALHLSNTLALTAFAALAAWRAGRPTPAKFLPRRRLAFWVGLALVVLTAMTGAVTALGDTLFPKNVVLGPSILAEVRDDLSASSHFLVRLRLLHPVVAIVAAGYLIWLLAREAGGNRWARAAMHLVAVEVVIGFFNIGLAAPGWLQIVHLLVAQGLWATLILTCASLGRASAIHNG